MGQDPAGTAGASEIFSCRGQNKHEDLANCSLGAPRGGSLPQESTRQVPCAVGTCSLGEATGQRDF